MVKTKKIRIIYSMLLIIVALIVFLLSSIYANAKKDEKGQVFFYTDTPCVEAQEYLQSNYTILANSISSSYGIESTIEFGNCLIVFNSQKFYYIPVFSGGKCITLLSLKIGDGGEPIVSYGGDNAEVINELEGGTYCFVNSDNGIYLVGERDCFVFEKEYSDNDAVDPYFDLSIYAKCDKIKLSDVSVISNGSYRSVLNKELTSVPRVTNPGNCCWLSSALSICYYYGYTTVTADQAHMLVHGLDHVVSQCPGGYRSQSYGIIHNYTGKTGDNTTSRRTAGDVLASINADIPVYSSWSYYSGGVFVSGHEMVICGYSFDNSTGAFTYTLMDPNYSSRRYSVSTYSATSVYYNIGPHAYEWKGSIYDWN